MVFISYIFKMQSPEANFLSWLINRQQPSYSAFHFSSCSNFRIMIKLPNFAEWYMYFIGCSILLSDSVSIILLVMYFN